MTVAWVPRGRPTTATMAWATPVGRMKFEWRAKPHAAHSLDDLAGDLGVPVHAHAGQGRAGPDDRGPHPGALELHLQRVDVALEPPLGGDVGRHATAGVARPRRR